MDTTPNMPEVLNTPPQLTVEMAAAETKKFMARVYALMSLALVITGVMAFVTASSPAMVAAIWGNQAGFWILFLAQIGIVIYLTARINKMSASTATIAFIVYSVLVGVFISCVFLVYTLGSIASTFFITAGTFGAMSALGYYTKTDLTKLGSLLYMALIGLIIASVVNMFMHSSGLYWITTYAGVLIFTGLTAYDTQKIKNMSLVGVEGGEENRKVAIMGALSLYLDFINLFLYLLRLFGRRR